MFPVFISTLLYNAYKIVVFIFLYYYIKGGTSGRTYILR